MSLDVHPESFRSAPGQADPSGAVMDIVPPVESPRWWVRGTLLAGVVTVLAVAGVILRGAIATPDAGPRLTHTVTRGDVVVTVTEEGLLESSENHEIKCRVRGQSTVIWVVESGTYVEPGDVLVRLDTLFIEEQVNERTKYAHWSRSAAERSKADVLRDTLAISEYEDGRFVEQLALLEKDLAIAESNLRTQQNMLRHVESLFERGFRSGLVVQETKFKVRQAELAVDAKKTEISVLKEFTREEQLETLQGNLKATEATHKANVERAEADASRRDRALIEREQCIIKAERAGVVIYPSAAKWKTSPDIEEGATVHKDQVLLLMPDMSRMQVKVGIHESMVDRVEKGMKALVRLGDEILEAKVSSVATVTQPAGWWTGNVVKYDTIIELPAVPGLKPGMSAEVDVILAEYEDVLSVPVAAVIDTPDGAFCWVKTLTGTERRPVETGDSNDIFVVIESGLKEGDEVFLNPTGFIDEARDEVLKQKEGKSSNDSAERKSNAKDSGTSMKKDSSRSGRRTRRQKPTDAGNETSAGSAG